jgi:hypothetical protein
MCEFDGCLCAGRVVDCSTTGEKRTGGLYHLTLQLYVPLLIRRHQVHGANNILTHLTSRSSAKRANVHEAHAGQAV